MSFSQEKNFDQSPGAALFTNLLLLGFDPYDAAAKYNVTIDSESFKVPNHKAFQVVSHFLLLCFDPKKEADLATCFPICSKKDERQFRSICYSYIRNLMESDPSANFPNFSASLFLSPGGLQFNLLYVAVSTYLLVRMIKNVYPEERFLSFPKNATSFDVLQSSTILEVNNCEGICKAIKHANCSFEDCMRSQSDAYWKISSEMQSFEKEMADEVVAITGTRSAERYYEEAENIEKDCAKRVVLVRKGWEQVNELHERVATCNKTIEGAIRRDEEQATLKASTNHSGAASCLETPLKNLITAAPKLQMKFSQATDALVPYKKSSIDQNENVHQMEEHFPRALKRHLDSLLREESGNEEYIHDGYFKLLQGKPELLAPSN